MMKSCLVLLLTCALCTMVCFQVSTGGSVSATVASSPLEKGSDLLAGDQVTLETSSPTWVLPLFQRAARPTQDEDTVSLTIDYGDRRDKREFEDIPWKEGMTVFDVMQIARRVDDSFSFRFRGVRDTLFITEIDGIENEGARGDNWVFRVDDKLGDRSCGVFEVPADAKIEWRWGEYDRNAIQ